MKPEYIIFDFDGTIADTYKLLKNIVKSMLGDYTKESFNFDSVRDSDIKDLFLSLNIPLYKLPFIIGRVKKELEKKIEKDAKLFPGMKQAIKDISSEYKLGILSSDSETNIRKFLKRNKVESYFEFVYSDASLFGKESMFKNLLKDKGLKAGHIVYICDEKRDILSCKNLKIPFVGVTWGYNSKDFLLTAKPKNLAEKPSELVALIR